MKRKGRLVAVLCVPIVLAAAMQQPVHARSGASALPSRADERSMARRFAEPFFLPRSVPRGFAFTHWGFRRKGFDSSDRRRTLFTTFRRRGLILDWYNRAGVDKHGDFCPRHGKPTGASRTFRRHGKRIFFGAGIHGAEAWRCIARGVVGNRRPLQVMLWYDIRLDGKKMRRRAVLMLATARLA